MQIIRKILGLRLEVDAGWYSRMEINAAFNSAARVDFYQMLSVLLECGVKLRDAINEMYKAASKDGKNSDLPLAVVYEYIYKGLGDGFSLHVLLENIGVDPQEVALIAAGEKSGDLISVCQYAIDLLDKKDRIKRSVKTATIYPIFNFLLAAFMLQAIATKFIPKLSKMTDSSTWTGSALMLKYLSDYVNNYGLFTLVSIVILVLVIVITMPTYSGPGRVYMDRHFPWGLFKTLHGSTFLMALAIMIKAGVKLKDALKILARPAKPWLKDRIDAAIYGIEIGKNLGDSLHAAGQEFPDARSIEYMRVLSKQDNFEDAISKFGQRWMDVTIKKLEEYAALARNIGIMVVGLIMVLIFTGAMEIMKSMAEKF